MDALLAQQQAYSLNKYFYTESEVGKIREHYQESNRRLEADYAVSLTDKLSACWNNELDKTSLHAELLTDATELIKTPICSFANVGDMDLEPYLTEGWHDSEPWGTWAQEEFATIRLRLPHRIRKVLELGSDAVRVQVSGRYYHGVEPKSDIRVGNLSFQDVRLKNWSVDIPFTDIPNSGVIELTIRNPQRTSPRQHDGDDDDRLISFGIQRLTVINLSEPLW